MLREFVEKGHYKFIDNSKSWQEAIALSCEPILKDKTIEPEYVESIIQNVEEYGPYIVIIPDVAMPHSQISSKGVNKTAITFMKVEKPVRFDENDREKDARLFFTIASCDHEQHLKNIMKLTEIFENEELIQELLKAKDKDDLIKLQEKYLD